ncbi:hypothetical protein [Pseudodesulfovibrio indicus]|uniref:hypothetical protein n=1 Tax=Pseudodesulfovibrio indicus TaxID=1716143 RepID=UPI00292D4BAC|nr:hypothetical protein [Pseudodesulfovibrio indicus]
MSEWNNVDPMLPVRQGDLLVCRDSSSLQDVEYFLVITADCDINNNKFGRQLACLRVVQLKEYYQSIWAERLLKKAIENADRRILDQVNKWYSLAQGSDASISKEALLHWLDTTSHEDIAKALNIDANNREKFYSTLERYHNAILILDNCSECALNVYVEFVSIFDAKRLDDVRSATVKKMDSNLPADVFLLPSLSTISDSPAVILLRELIGIPFEKICYRARDAVGKNNYIRALRLNPVFKYAVSQAFGHLYSRIGLPEEFENQNKCVVEKVKDTWEY